LILSLLFGWFVLLSGEYNQLSRHIMGATSFTSNYILWNEAGYFDGAAKTKPLLHLWSLAIEEQFYILWPIFLWFLFRYKLNYFFLVLGITIASFFLNIYSINVDRVATFYSPFTRFWEILCGSLVAIFFFENKNVLNKTSKILSYYLNLIFNKNKPTFNTNILFDLLGIVGLTLIAFALFKLNDHLLFPGYLALFPVLGTVIVLLSNSKSIVTQYFLTNRFVVWFGLISYPLYLFHWPILSFARIIYGDVPGKFVRLALIFLSVILAWLTYKFLEKPIRSSKLKVRSIFFFLILMLAVSFFSFIIYQNNGLQFRHINILNKHVSEALNYDWKAGFRRGECYIDDTDSQANYFSMNCGKKINKDNSSLLIWGDSHSASLYRGFESYLKPKNISLFQFTSSGCPPILNFKVDKRIKCIENNNFVLSEIKRLKPQNVVLGAYWSLYDGTDGFNRFDAGKLIETIRILKELQIQNITVIGHLPSYTINQPDILRSNIFYSSVIKDRTYSKFRNDSIIYDKIIRKISEFSGVNFVSPLDLLCNDQGCLLAVPGIEKNLLSFDYGHLTSNGSEYLVSRMFDSKLLTISK